MVEPIFLVALFFYQGEWTMLQGFHPLLMPSVEVCEERKEYLHSQLALMDLPEYHLTCLQTLPENGDEAVKDYINNNLPDT